MTTLVIKNFPEALHSRLKEQAQRNHRSLTKEAVHLIESGLAVGTPKRPLPPLLRLRSGRRPSIEEIEAAIAKGQD